MAKSKNPKSRKTKKSEITKSRKSKKAISRESPKSRRAKNARAAGKRAASDPALAGVRPPGHGKRGERGYLGYLLRQAQAASRLVMERVLSDLGVTPPQFVVLTMLKAYPGLSGADLARVALLTPQTIGVIIRNLERSGAIRKTPHPVHGRLLMWTLTRSGLALLGKCRRLVLGLERRLGASLTARNDAVVRRWLAQIAMLAQG
jgi:DNA-binding MarR family transcriptional regulator